MKKQRLNKKDLEGCLKVMRRWPKTYMDEVAKLVHHIHSQADDITKLEARVHELSQADFFKQKQALATQSVKSEGLPIERHPLPKRLALMVEAGTKGSPEWISTLKWNQLNEDRANILIIEYYKTLDM